MVEQHDGLGPNTDLSAERAVLAGLYAYGQDAYLDVAPMLTQFSFTDPANQGVYKCFVHMFEERQQKQLDESSFISVAKELGYNWIIEKKEELNHLRSIFNTHIVLENVRAFAARLSRLEITRLLRQNLAEANVELSEIRGHETIEHILGIPEQKIFDFSSKLMGKSTNEPTLLGVGLREHLVDRMNNPVEMVGFPSPWKIYNEAIGGGWRKKALSLIGARSGVGKSIIADNATKFTADTLKIPALYIDTEMNSEDHWYRVTSNISNVQIREVETGKCGSDQQKRQQVMGAIEKIEGMPFYYLNVTGLAFEETLAIIRRWIHKVVGFHPDGKTKDCLIFYDYIKLMNDESLKFNVGEFQILGFMMTALHNVAVRNDVAIVVLTQLNRDGLENEDAGVIAGSDRIVWIATNIAVFKPKSDEEIANGDLEHGSHKMVIIKQRHGPGMARGDYINMHMRGAFAQLTEGKTRFQLRKQNAVIQPPPQVADCEDIPFGDNNQETKDAAQTG